MTTTGETGEQSEPVSPRDRLTASYVAARGFLWGEWLGAFLCVLSFTELYFAVAARALSGAWAVGLGLLLLAVGGFVFLRSRTYYLRLGVRYKPRSHNLAAVVAGAGAIFWLLFATLIALTLVGYPILPE